MEDIEVLNTLVFSDTHLTNKFDERKFNYLSSIIESADRVVINGDFWEGFAIDFDSFCDSHWKRLFPLLLSKNTIYLTGNHDKKEWLNQKANLFSVRQLQFVNLKLGDQEYFITHGHMVKVPREERYPFLDNKFVLRLAPPLDRFSKKYLGKRFVNSKNDGANQAFKVWTNDNLEDNQILVTGHTHYPEVDRSKRFANSGFIEAGLGSYLFINGSGVELIRDSY